MIPKTSGQKVSMYIIYTETLMQYLKYENLQVSKEKYEIMFCLREKNSLSCQFQNLVVT